MQAVPIPTQRPEFLQLEDFLTREDHARLLEYALSSQDFEPAQVTKPGGLAGEHDRAVRSASVVSPEPFFDVFEQRLVALLPHARIVAGVGRFVLGSIERQLAAHRDGDFFELHTDVGDPWTAHAGRRLSFVYYFHATPRRFDGGQLRLYDAQIDEHGRATPASTFQDIEPLDNSIVFFSSSAFHEVRPVIGLDRDAPGSVRFAVTGWFHDAAHVASTPPLGPDEYAAIARRYLPSFTDVGFLKVRTPPSIHRRLRAVYDERLATAHPEHVPGGEAYLNEPPDFIDIHDIANEIHEQLRPLHESWSGVELVPTAAYGLRVYRHGQTLRCHVDRVETHVISSIVHLAHDTDEPWPLRFTDLHGEEHDIILEEGEMLLYESARCAHGRPTPLQGASYCSLFLHYMPVDWDHSAAALAERARADSPTELVAQRDRSARA